MNEALTSIWSCIAILLLLWVIVLYRKYQLDRYRQCLFALRDQFFIEAIDGKISLNSSAYGLLRTTMNGAIRFAHKTTLWQCILMHFTVAREKEFESSFPEELERALSALNSEQRDLCAKYLFALNMYAFERVLFSSLVSTSAYYIFISLHRIKRACSHLSTDNTSIKNIMVRQFRKPVNSFDSAALIIGKT